MVRAMAENQARMMESMMAGMRQPPPPPQKDAAEWLIPFISQMNQQAQAQQQANQQMLVGIMQANQQFMQAMLQKESPVEKMLFAQLQEVKAEARSPKGDEMEDFANKLQKMKMVSDMLGGGGGASSMLGELLANAEAIGEGAAKIIAASKSKVIIPAQPTPQMAGVPQPQPQQQQLPPAGPPPTPEVVAAAFRELEDAAGKGYDQVIVTAVVTIVRGLIESGEPYTRMGQKILGAFRDMDDADEMFTLAKSLWIVANAKHDKKLAKVVSTTLVRWYSVIHEQLFGVAREIGEEAKAAPNAGLEQAEQEIDSDEEEDETDEDEIEDAEAVPA
jgi:hypothetical protein